MKILIAEDEPLSLKNLLELDWASVGIDTVLAAKDGKEAYETALREKPEIILSDIQMPKMTGLELAEKLSVNLPESHFIILTAYNNFHYAQSAISIGVSSYLLKPFMDEDVLEAVSSAIADIKAAQIKNTYNVQTTRQLEFSKHFLLNYFFSAVADESADANELCDIFNISDRNAICTAMVISFEHAEITSFKDNYKIFNHLTKIFTGHNAVTLSFFNTTQLIYFFLSDSSSTSQQAMDSVLACADAAKTYLNFNFS